MVIVKESVRHSIGTDQASPCIFNLYFSTLAGRVASWELELHLGCIFETRFAVLGLGAATTNPSSTPPPLHHRFETSFLAALWALPIDNTLLPPCYGVLERYWVLLRFMLHNGSEKEWSSRGAS